MRIALVVLLSATAATTPAQDHSRCPIDGAAGHKAQVDHRHQTATGLPTEGTEHHIVLAPDGGSIRLGVKDARQAEARDSIRAHLRVIARSFAAVDFGLPTRIHDQTPPGVETMKARKNRIDYAYADSGDGGVVTIRTADREALAAVHEFLRFQIRDHGTGDPSE